MKKKLTLFSLFNIFFSWSSSITWATGGSHPPSSLTQSHSLLPQIEENSFIRPQPPLNVQPPLAQRPEAPRIPKGFHRVGGVVNPSQSLPQDIRNLHIRGKVWGIPTLISKVDPPFPPHKISHTLKEKIFLSPALDFEGNKNDFTRLLAEFDFKNLQNLQFSFKNLGSTINTPLLHGDNALQSPLAFIANLSTFFKKASQLKKIEFDGKNSIFRTPIPYTDSLETWRKLLTKQDSLSFGLAEIFKYTPKIESLSFKELNFTPASLTHLLNQDFPHLTSLRFNQCAFGAITDFRHITPRIASKIKSLSFNGFNDLNSKLQHFLAQFSNLEHLSFTNTSYPALVPFKYLPQLKSLNLSYANLSLSRLPQDLPAGILSLNLQGNTISQEIFQRFSSPLFQNLHNLNLEDNALAFKNATDFNPSPLLNLKHLQVEMKTLTYESARHIFQDQTFSRTFPNLETLALSLKGFGTNVIKTFAQAIPPHLTSLSLNQNLEDSELECLGQACFTELKELGLCSRFTTDHVIDRLSTFPWTTHLKTLTLSDTSVSPNRVDLFKQAYPHISVKLIKTSAL